MKNVLILRKQNMFTQACTVEIPIYEEIDFAGSIPEAADIIANLIKDDFENKIQKPDGTYIITEIKQ